MSELSKIKSTCKSEPAGMSIIIINSRNPALKFKFCSVFSAKNPTVNDASVTMLSVRNYRTLSVERGTCFNPLQALTTSPSAD